MIDRIVDLQIGANAPPPIVECTEGDTMWRWHFRLFWEGQRWSIPSGAVCMFTGQKADGNVFDLLASLSNNEVIADTGGTDWEQVTAAVGPVAAVVRVIDSYGKTVASCPLVLAVRPNPQTQGPMSATVLSAYNDVLQLLGGAVSVPKSVSDWLDAHVDPSTGYVVDNSLSISGAAADAKTVGDKVDFFGGLFAAPYVPSNLSVMSDGLIYLQMGYITADTGESKTSSAGTYYKTQVGNDGTATFILIDGRPLMAHVGLSWIEWNCWSYSGGSATLATHSNTGKKYISGLRDIQIPGPSNAYNDRRFALSFRKQDRTAFTAEELLELRGAIKFYRATDAKLSTSGAAADAAATGALLDTKAAEGMDFLAAAGTFSTKTASGITFSWGKANGVWACTLSGTATAQAIYKIIDSPSALPLGMAPGDKLFMRFESNENVNIQYYVEFYDQAGNGLRPLPGPAASTSGGPGRRWPWPMIVPDTAAGIVVQLRVATNYTANTTVTRMQLVKMHPRTMDRPLIVSFVDDDTTAVAYVEKYRNACLHNGFVGNYAMVSTNMGGSTPDAENENRTLLLQYEAEGFGMLTHGDKRQAELPWQSLSTKANRDACRADLCSALRLFRKWGFCNYNFWITPYGIHSTNAKRLAQELGFRCMISTNNYRHNSMQDGDRWYIKRVALHQDDAGEPALKNTMADVKAAIDATVAAGAGWLIITTHFNEWGGLAWDDTVDETGYPVGYARFNEMVQYAKDAGLTPLSFPRAFEMYEPVLEANRMLWDEANAT